MIYVIMCGGNYHYWKYPKQLSMINNETLIERTVRLLTMFGVDKKNIYITVNSKLKDILTDQRYFAHPPATLHMNHNSYEVDKPNDFTGLWCDCFANFTGPRTYLMGDVVYSPEAIRTIIETPTDDIEFFASAPPFAKNYCKEWAEPFAFKVVNEIHLAEARKEVEILDKYGAFRRKPIAWELWQVIKGTELNKIDYTNYTVINDYTCDIDKPEDIGKFEGGSEWLFI